MSEPLRFDTESHEYFLGLRKIPGVNEVIRFGGFGAHYDRIPPNILEAARRRGVAVHAAVEELEMLGAEPDLELEHRPYFESYLRWREGADWVAKACELRVHGNLGSGLDYGGTVDLSGSLDSQPCIIDLKTSSARPGKEAHWQLAAYAAAVEVYPESRFLLHLQKDGTKAKELRSKTGLDDMRAWETLLRYYYLRGGV